MVDKPERLRKFKAREREADDERGAPAGRPLDPPRRKDGTPATGADKDAIRRENKRRRHKLQEAQPDMTY